MIDFPSNPTDGQQFTSGNSSWVWNAAASQWRTALIPNAVLDNTVTASKLTSTAITDKLGYTPVNKAGDTFTGNVSISNGANGKLSMGNATYYGSVEHDASVTGANIYNVAAASGGGHKFKVGSTEIVEIHKNGGIKFPASQLSNSDVNTLDDYEEGTWTPVIAGAGAGGCAMTSGASGTYTKIGNVVYVTCLWLTWSSKTAMSGNVTISGLPFTSRASLRAAGVSGGSPAGSFVMTGKLVPALDGGVNFLWLIGIDNTNNTYFHLQDSNVASSGTLYGFTMTYHV